MSATHFNEQQKAHPVELIWMRLLRPDVMRFIPHATMGKRALTKLIGASDTGGIEHGEKRE
ncbi:hypothetical protein A1A1_15793 [Planococcus antarcticus DSM 14505]|uniref:Uncharacterized protein n=1 Tax=Planococcus antarcticus DSM 14505 TaxID=1185653 RepID=A0A1C7DE76_9BACL|nr:hypothetical protein BBH88_05075 [Planococcus antarcticus DSM 14505]EIM05548.1 hypothetical protein A1A1_15793 [Planococcus antarcticus DSM 14505]